MIKARKLRYATLETPDLQRTFDYFTGVHGMACAAKGIDDAWLAASQGQLALRLRQVGGARCSALAFQVAEGVDLCSLQKKLTDAGIWSEARSHPAPGVARSLALQDPNGTEIELFSEAVTPDLDRRRSGIGTIKLGHVAFFTADPSSLAQFYESILEFRVSDWLEDFFVFMRCDADHHSVNFLRGDPPRMHHMAFELNDAAHLCDACDQLAQNGIPLAYGPVRFGPGHNVAVFHRSPDGQLVEFYAELDQMKDEELGYFEPRPWHRERPQRPKTWKLADDPIWGPPPPPGFL